MTPRLLAAVVALAPLASAHSVHPAPSACLPLAADDLKVSGQVVDAEGRPLSGASVELVGHRDEVVSRTEADAGGRYRLALQNASPRVAAALFVDAPGFVRRRVGLYEGERDESYGTQIVQLDLELEVGHRVTVRFKTPEGAPVKGLEVELQPGQGSDLLAVEVPFRAITDDAGDAVFEDAPRDGLFVVKTPGRGWLRGRRLAVDLERQEHTFELPSTVEVSLTLGEACFEGFEAREEEAFTVRFFCEREHAWGAGQASRDTPLVLRGIPCGEEVGLLLVRDDGASRWLGTVGPFDADSRSVEVAASPYPVVRGERFPSNTEAGTTLQVELVDQAGDPITFGGLGGFWPREITAAWSRSGATGLVGARNWSAFGRDAPVVLQATVPPPLPLRLQLRFGGYRAEPVLVTDRRLSVAVPVHLSLMLGKRSSVTFKPAEGIDPGVGWGLHGFRARDGARIAPMWRPEGADRAFELELPAGDYSWTATSRAHGTATGRIAVVAGTPSVVEVAFPGVGAMTGRIECDAQILSLSSFRSDGAPGASGALTIHLEKDGTFVSRDLVAGTYGLVARLQMPEGPLLKVIASDLRVAPDQVTDHGVLRCSAATSGGRIITRSEASIPVSASIHRGSVMLNGGVFRPGDRAWVPGEGNVRVLLGADLLNRRAADGWLELPPESEGGRSTF